MKNRLQFLGLVLLGFFAGTQHSYCQENNTSWQTDSFENMLENTRSLDKDLLVYVCEDFSMYCGEEEEELHDPRVVAALSERFTLGFLPTFKHLSSPKTEQIRIWDFPTFLVFDPEGNIVYHHRGSLEITELVKFGKEGVPEGKYYAEMKDRYDSGERSLPFMKTYFDGGYIRGEDLDEPIMEYLEQLPDSMYREDDAFQIMCYVGFDLTTRHFQYIVENATFYRKKYGDLGIDNLLLRSYSIALDSACNYRDSSLFEAVQHTTLTCLGPEEAEEVLQEERMQFTAAHEDWDRYAEIALQHFAQFSPDEWELENEAAWNFYLHIEDPVQLEKALVWSERSIQKQKTFYNLDTKASLLFKLGRWEESKGFAIQAIQAAKYIGEDYSETQKLLERME